MNKSRLAIFAAILLLSPALAPAALGESVDASKGKQRAEVCMSCHGEDGITTVEPAVPRLAGQSREYLIKALNAYRIGVTRTDDTMTAMSKPLTDADVANIAAYFSALPPKR